MGHRVIIRPEAEAELGEAYRWYDAQRPGLGDEFLLCIDACMASIQRYPKMHPVVQRNVRRALVRRFPYGIFYLIQGETVSVIAIFHSSRDPRQWKKRSETSPDAPAGPQQ